MNTNTKKMIRTALKEFVRIIVEFLVATVSQLIAQAIIGKLFG